MYIQNEAPETNNIHSQEPINLGLEANNLSPEELIKVIRPYIATMGISGAAGLATGAALKYLASKVLVIIGLLFLFLQTLIYFDFVEMKWASIQDKSLPYVDLNHDGVFNEKDVALIYENGVSLATQGLPNVGAFLVGAFIATRFI